MNDASLGSVVVRVAFWSHAMFRLCMFQASVDLRVKNAWQHDSFACAVNLQLQCFTMCLMLLAGAPQYHMTASSDGAFERVQHLHCSHLQPGLISFLQSCICCTATSSRSCRMSDLSDLKVPWASRLLNLQMLSMPKLQFRKQLQGWLSSKARTPCWLAWSCSSEILNIRRVRLSAPLSSGRSAVGTAWHRAERAALSDLWRRGSNFCKFLVLSLSGGLA